MAGMLSLRVCAWSQEHAAVVSRGRRQTSRFDERSIVVVSMGGVSAAIVGRKRILCSLL